MVWIVIILVVITAYIDYLRIKAAFGKPNVSKVVSVAIGIALYSPVVFIWGIQSVAVIIASRGVFYDIVLNLLRKLPISYRSSTTNSLADKIEAYIFPTFWIEKLFYFIILMSSLIFNNG